MPTLDISELTLDPDFCEPFTVTRRMQVMVKGVATVQAFAIQAFGSIQSKDTAIGGNTIEREPNMTYRGASLDVYTQTRLYGPQEAAAVGDEFMPDLITYNGDPFIVVLVNDYSHYGAGFVHAECTSIPSVDRPPT